MEKISFDSGIRSYRLNDGGVLRFNPGDPNIYGRFLDAGERITQVEKELRMEAGSETTGEEAIRLLLKADGKIKEILSWVFGEPNDFHKLLGGINLMAVADNGQRVVTNLFAALQPILTEGAKRCAKEQTEEAVRRAKERRGEA